MRTDIPSVCGRGPRGGRHLRAGSLLPLVALVLALAGSGAGSREAPATESCTLRCGASGSGGAAGWSSADRARLLPVLRLSGGRAEDVLGRKDAGGWSLDRRTVAGGRQGDDPERVAAGGFGSASREEAGGTGVTLAGRGEDEEGGVGVHPDASGDEEGGEEKEWITSRGVPVPDNPEALAEMADTVLHMATYTPHGEEPENPARLQERSKQGASLARELLRRALFLSPSHPPSVCLLADLQYQTGAIQEAEALFQKAARLAPSEGGPLTALAEIREEAGELKEARNLYERAHALRPDRVDITSNLARLRRITGDGKGALQAYQEALTQEPSQPDMLSNLAGLLQSEPHLLPDAAPLTPEVLLRRALLIEPGHIYASCNLARLLRDEKGRVDHAAGVFDRATKAAPLSAPAWLSKAATLLSGEGEIEQEKVLEAEEALEMVVLLEPGNMQALVGLAQIEGQRRFGFAAEDEDEDTAEKPPQEGIRDVEREEKLRGYFEEAVDLMPDNAEAWTAFAVFEADLGEGVEKGEAVFEQALSRNPSDPSVLREAALFQQQRAKDGVGAAEQLYRMALAIDPDDVPTLVNFGVLEHVKRTRLESAEGLYKRALCLEPSSSGALANYASLLHDRGDENKARDMMTRARALDPTI